MSVFRVKSVKIYSHQKNFTRIYPWDPWQISGMTYMFRALGWYGLWALEQIVGLDGLTGWYPFDGYDYKSSCNAKNRETMKTISLNTVAINKRRRTRSEDLALSTSLLSIPYYSDIFWSDVYYWNLDICERDIWFKII